MAGTCIRRQRGWRINHFKLVNDERLARNIFQFCGTTEGVKRSDVLERAEVSVGGSHGNDMDKLCP